jgi:hypothetical protein
MSSNRYLTHGVPWLVESAVRWLDDLQLDGAYVFEWGAGGSTIYFASRGATVRSVEHSVGWVRVVNNTLKSRGLLAQCKVVLVPQDAKPSSNPAYGSWKMPGTTFESYVRTGAHMLRSGLPPKLILVDGRARPACLREAAETVASGCFLLLDNSNRSAYSSGIKDAESVMNTRGGFDRFDHTGPGRYGGKPWKTTIWRKT